MGFIGVGLKIRRRLAVISGERKEPQLASQTGGINIKQKSSIWRPVIGHLPVTRLEMQILLARTARVLLIQIERAVPVRSKDDAASVRRPHGLPVDRGIKGNLGASVPREFVYPEVVVWWSAACFPSLGARAAEYDSSSIGGERQRVVVTRSAESC